jgi:CP family cyanate transporter-like MFS transporter
MAANLRAPLASYPPVLDAVRATLGLSAGMAGFAQASAVLAMAAGSFAGAPLAARVGSERALAVAVGGVGVGCLLRGVRLTAALVGGTALVGLGIGAAGVFLAGVVRTRFAARAGALTGGYVVAMMLGATASSALAVPLAATVGGWSLSLAVWAVPALLTAGVWASARGTGRARRGTGGERAERPARRTGWTPLARVSACYLSGASLVVYGWMTWLAPYYQSLGWTPVSAGLLLGAWSVVQVPAALLVPALAERRRRWTFWASLVLGCALAGTVGALVAPTPPLVGPWLWVALIGFGSGAGFPLGLAVIAWRSADGAASAVTSGLAMGVGYTVAGLGPLAMGLLVDAGGYPPAFGVLLAGAAAQGWAIRRLADPDASRPC